MARSAALVLAALVLAGGCGGEAGDLMAIEVSGGPSRARTPLDIVLAGDGRGTCNGRPSETVPSDVVIEARELERELEDLAEDGARYGATRDGRREYIVRIKAGTVRWAEGEPDLPEVLPRAQLLAVQLDRLLCRA